MNTTEFLSYLKNMDIRLWSEGPQLRVSAPKGVLTPELREQLQTRKPEILAFLGPSLQSVSAGPLPIRLVSRDGELKLSFAQQRLWFLSQLEPESNAYNILGGIRLKGRLRIDVFNRCLSEIIRRHEALRTTFHEKDGSPRQVILPPFYTEAPFIDLRQYPKSEREARLNEIIGEQSRKPFDLSKSPLLRIVLLQLDEDEHAMISAFHHIITDGWSMGVFTREFEVLYKAFSQGEPSPLPDLAIQYADFAQWQLELLQGDVLQSRLEYWKKQLGKAPRLCICPRIAPGRRFRRTKGSSRFSTSPCLFLKS